MTAPATKKSKVVDALIKKDYKTALRIAKGFKIELTKEENAIVTRAYEMTWGSSFYEQLGYNKEDQFNKAVAILKRVYEVE